MWRNGRFNLTKFISNSKEILISIPEDKTTPGVMDLNLLGGIPVGKSLGGIYHKIIFLLTLDSRGETWQRG